MRYFFISFIFLIAGIFTSYFYLGGLEATYIIILLILLEVSLSFDNAVINAKVLNTMDPIWRKRFIVYGIPIAVFGIRFILPIVIVALSSDTNLLKVLKLAIYDIHAYKLLLEESMNKIYAFGGAFLLSVFFDFYFIEKRDEHWIGFLENNFLVKYFSKISQIVLLLAIGVGLILTKLTQDYSVAIAYFIGIFLHSLLSSLDELLNVKIGVRSGLMGFIYLEILDSSFSLDGVVGAFAMSSNILVIMIGLGIGAFFVRSLTLYFVNCKILDQFVYLEHGAHYAIFVLAIIMFIHMFTHVSEWITGTAGVLIISASVVHSIIISKKRKKIYANS